MPRAAILSPFPDSRGGGIERFCHQLADALRDGGWDADVVGAGPDPSIWIDRVGAGTFTRSRSAVRRAVELRPDLVVGNNWLGWSTPRDLPHVQVYHCTLFGMARATGAGLSLRERVQRPTVHSTNEALGGRGARVVAVSSGVADELRRYYRLTAAQIIGNAVDTAVFRPRDRTAARAQFGLTQPTALFVGRAEWGKGSDVAVAGARAAGFDVLHAGRKVLPGAQALGPISEEDLATALAAADCLLLPSRYEAFGLAFAEAAAVGTPIVAPRVGWMQDLIAAVPDYAALTIEPTVDSVAEGLRRLATVDTPALTAAAQAYALEHVGLERFDAAWLALCNEAVADRAAPLRG